MAPVQPPGPYTEFAFNFPSREFPLEILASPGSSLPDLPASNLLSSAETDSFFGFLDKLEEWEFDPALPHGMPVYSTPSSGSDAAAPQPPSSPPSFDSSNPIAHHSLDSYTGRPIRSKAPPDHAGYPPPPAPRSSASSSSSPPPRTDPPHHNHTTRTKPLLSTPQKRLNHIMSEQKRRNAIRDGYATLTNMLAPAGAPVGSGIPTRGRPKGSGMRGKGGAGGAKGKSGVLFRAVEYCRWLEEGCESLRTEVERIELAAGLGGDVR